MKSLHESMLDPDLFGQTFAGPTFANWRTVAKVLDGLPLERNDSSNFHLPGRRAFDRLGGIEAGAPIG
jgi:hypothetical protein